MIELKCFCVHCGQPVEYPDDLAGLGFVCPSCLKAFQLPGKAVIPPTVPPPMPLVKRPPPKSVHPILAAVIITVFGLGLVQFNNWIDSHRSSGGSFIGAARDLEPVLDFDVWLAAKKLIAKAYPGAKGFSHFDKSAVQKNGSDYIVTLTVDGVNGFNAPIRKKLVVLMEASGDTVGPKIYHGVNRLPWAPAPFAGKTP